MNRDQALLDAVTVQRNAALNQVATLQVEVASANEQLAEMQALRDRLDALEAKLPAESIQCVHEVGQDGSVAAG